VNSKKTLLILSLIFVFLIVGAVILYNNLKDDAAVTPENVAESNEPEVAKNPAPGFTVYDKYGNSVSLADFKGKPVVINFWATWCGPCQSEMPHFEKAYKKYGKDIHFLMINLTDGMRDTPQTVQEFIDYFDYSFSVYYDIGYVASDAYDINPIPASFFIDKDGNLISQQIGALSSAALEKHISLIK